jgi:hypothetical protein
MDFRVTRLMLVSVEDWFIPVLKPFMPLKKIQMKDGFYWDFEEHSAKTALLGKALRIISG